MCADTALSSLLPISAHQSHRHLCYETILIALQNYCLFGKIIFRPKYRPTKTKASIVNSICYREHTATKMTTTRTTSMEDDLDLTPKRREFCLCCFPKPPSFSTGLLKSSPAKTTATTSHDDAYSIDSKNSILVDDDNNGGRDLKEHPINGMYKYLLLVWMFYYIRSNALCVFTHFF